MTTGRGTRTTDYDYPLPEDRIAQHPIERRDASRLLLLDRDDGSIRHLRFADLAELVLAGDALVLNESRVLPARLVGRKPTGAPAEILLVRPTTEPEDPDAQLEAEGHTWHALVRPGGKLKPGRVVDIADDLRVHILDSTPDGGRIVRLECDGTAEEALRRHGRVPLPPYIRREPDPIDQERYQTVYARAPGSVAAPTAGLHLTPALLDRLEQSGVHVVRVVLHVGIGTFRPVDVEDPAEHAMDAEWYRVDNGVAERLNRVREGGGSVWAVGTTVARTLETVADEAGRIHGGSGWTELFIRPPYRFLAVDRLVTNFHLPRSTLLMLVAAFGGYERVMAAYGESVERGYRFYSYGDAMAVV